MASQTFAEMKKAYLKIFASLIALTALTVLVTTVHFGDTMNVVVGITVAVFKAALVAYIFMHLKFDNKRLRYFVAVPLFFFVVMVFALTSFGSL
jgi:cytochrome c oxidase subunit IV